MRTAAAFLFASFLLFPAGAIAGPAAPLPLSKPPMLAPAKLVCGMVDGKFKCKNVKDGTIGIEIDDGKKKDKGDGGGGGGGGEGEEEAKGCPPGYNTLPEPTKYGSVCEPPEGLPNNAYKSCPPGANGTPPACVCPGDTVYGDKGNKCVAKNGGGGGGGGGAGGAGGGGGGGGGPAGDANGDAEEAKGCPPGYNTLPEPTKYGSVCEPPGGLPNNAYKSCPPGATGTPPNCACPGQSDYGTQGNKCIGWTGGCGTDDPGWNKDNFFCKNSNADKTECTILPDGKEKCCCKTYDK